MSFELFGHVLWVDEVAVASSFTFALTVLSALCFSEVTDGTVLNSNLVVIIILSILVLVARFCLLFVAELNIDVSDHVLADVVDHHHINDLTVSAELDEDLFVEFFKMLCCLEEFFLTNLEAICKRNSCHRVAVQVEE